MDRHWCFGTPLGDDHFNYDVDQVLPRLRTLFGINNQALRVIFLQEGTEKSFINKWKFDDDSIESFKSYNVFDIKHLEVSVHRLNVQKRSKHVKFYFCEDQPDVVWKWSLKGGNKVRPDNILGLWREALDFVAAVLVCH